MIIPSIDLMNGRAVQLRQGKHNILTSSIDPLVLAQQYNRCGPIAVIDLDAALGTGTNNLKLIKQICRVADVRVGGGIRDISRAQELLRAGAQYIIIGTAATPDFLQRLSRDKIIVALDHKNGFVVDEGWTKTTTDTIYARAERLAPYCAGFLCTFVEHEGTMSGIPLDGVQELQARLSRPITVAGGVSNTQEAISLIKMGVNVQVGMSLYTDALDLVHVVVGSLNFDKNPLIPTIVQDQSGQILMLAYSSRESLDQALRSGTGIYFSRSRNAIWKKGESSGNSQELLSCRVDCDRDALIFTVRQTGHACHSGSYSCFGSRAFSAQTLFSIVQKRIETLPAHSYTSQLLTDRSLLLNKIIEEANEVIAAKNFDELTWEIADLLYFTTVLAQQSGVRWEDIIHELRGRNHEELS